MRKKEGISLIVLIITIVVVLILAAAVIMNLTGNNPINSAKISKVCTNYDNIKTDIALYINNAKVETKSYFTTEEILTGTGSVRKGIDLSNSKAEKNDDGRDTWNAGGYKLINKDKSQNIKLNNNKVVEAYKIPSDKYKELVNKLPETPTSDSEWYIDINTNVYLVYESLDKIPKWLRAKAKDTKITDDVTLSMFLAIKTTDDADNTTEGSDTEKIEYDDYTPSDIFEVGSDGSLKIKGSGTLPSNLQIPSKIGGNTVTEIPNGCFQGKTELVNVKLPDTLVTVGNAAFYGCTNLEDVKFSSSIKKINGQAFFNCVKLKKVIIPEGVQTIGSDCFCNCSSVEYVSLPTTLKQIGSNFFNNTNAIKKIAIPQGVINGTNNVANVFQSNKNVIETITFNGTITYIGDRAFYELTGLKNVELPSTVTSIGSWSFAKCGMSSITIPASVTSIGSNAFAEGNFTNLIFKGSIPSGQKWGANNATLTTEK